jgi:cysteinyl-tRNA synthetase
VETLRELTALLGIFGTPAQRQTQPKDELVGELLDLLIDLRGQARKKKDFATADQIRDGLSDMGVSLEDRKDGTHWQIDG